MYNKTKIKSKAKQSNNALTTGSRNELIQIQSINGEQLIDAKELHQFLKIKTPFNHWIARRIDEYQFKLNQDFWSNLTKRAKGRPTTDYQLTLDMAKELAMIERNDKGRQIRQYFIACEKKMRQQLVALPSTNQNLKSPSTADFGSVIKANFAINNADSTITIQNYVDAQNSFGAKMRMNYIAKFKYVSGDVKKRTSYILKDIQTD